MCLESICIPSISTSDFSALLLLSKSLLSSIPSTEPSDVTLDVAILNTDLANVLSVATVLLSPMLLEWIVVTEALEEKLWASTAPSFASPNIIAEVLLPLLAAAVCCSLSNSPSVVS